jgi:hypothetical protein
MSRPNLERLRSIKTLSQLTNYLRDDLDWPIESDDIEDISFDYTPGELGLGKEPGAWIKEIKQLRPLAGNQPWGIFWVNFEKKRLPVTIMRLILRALVIKKRASANKADRQAWQSRDLLFISAYGEESERAVTFAHFVENPGNNLTELRVLGWDDDDTPLHMEYIAGMLQEKLRWDEKLVGDAEAWRDRWAEAFTIPHRHVVRTSQELALALANLARRIRSRIRTILRYEDGFGEMRKLQRAFQHGLIHDLDDDGFADMFAQTVTYGLFSMACRRTVPGEGTAFSKDELPHYFTSPFLKEMLGVFLGIKSRKGAIDFDELGVSDVTDLLTSPDTHMEVVLADFNNKTRGEDPVIHFYEHFLSAYNKQLKIQRGVFYTPQPVVSYIVRSVHELLQTEFGLADGLADTTTWGAMLKKHPSLKLPPLTDEPGEKRTISPDEPFVQILDPATGTATFLVEVIDVIHKHLQGQWKQQHLTEAQQRAAWNDYVPQHLLPRLHAFELMMAPYAIAHMKIGLKLAETGYRFSTEERARIYLTNALEPWVKQLPLIGFDALAHEAAAVNEIKRHKRFTVVTGNPPYAGHSTNTGGWISNLVNDYYSIAGEPLRERNSKWLQDDYVKFIRLAQNSLAVTRVGVLGYITNHSFLDNPTFRGMRYSLLSTFSELRLLDLHGNSKKREKAPDGSADENVFDIQQGVAITVARVGPSNCESEVRHAHLYGERIRKYAELSRGTANRTQWQMVAATAPFYLLFPQDVTIRAEYERGIRLPEAMPVNVLGFQSHRDGFAVAFDRSEIRERISKFRSAAHSDKELANLFETPDNRDWQISAARAQVKSDKNWEENIITCAYRPFDFRACYFSTVAMDYPRRELLDHVAWRENLCLNTTRQTKAIEWRNAVVTDKPAPAVFVELKDGSNTFPLWLFPDPTGLSFSTERRPNFSDSFLRALAAALHIEPKKPHGLPAGLTPEDIFQYAYAVFHSPGYRRRYAEFLKIDFPRLPLTGNLELFRALARLGGELTALHLLESPKLAQPITGFIGGRHPEVEKISWSRDTVWVDKAQTTGFQGVRRDVWEFHIGGYQVCEKWLKDRKGRTLTKDDLVHYQKIVVALSETIRVMAEIDKAIEKNGGWPNAFVTSKTTTLDMAKFAAMSYPSTALEIWVCAAELALVAEEDGIESMDHLDALWLMMKNEWCQTLLPPSQRAGFAKLLQSSSGQPALTQGQMLGWRQGRDYLEKNRKAISVARQGSSEKITRATEFAAVQKSFATGLGDLAKYALSALATVRRIRNGDAAGLTPQQQSIATSLLMNLRGVEMSV